MLSTTGLFLLNIQYMPMNFLVAAIPIILALTYPFARVYLGSVELALMDASDSILLVINTLLSFLAYAYIARETYTSDTCNYYNLKFVRCRCAG